MVRTHVLFTSVALYSVADVQYGLEGAPSSREEVEISGALGQGIECISCSGLERASFLRVRGEWGGGLSGTSTCRAHFCFRLDCQHRVKLIPPTPLLHRVLPWLEHLMVSFGGKLRYFSKPFIEEASQNLEYKPTPPFISLGN